MSSEDLPELIDFELVRRVIAKYSPFSLHFIKTFYLSSFANKFVNSYRVWKMI